MHPSTFKYRNTPSPDLSPGRRSVYRHSGNSGHIPEPCTCTMYINTKRSIFAFVGTSMAALALVLALVGIQYDATAANVDTTEARVTEIILKRATPIWAGILLVLFGVRNLTLGGAVWKYKGYGCSDVCEAVLVNILAFLTAGGCLGIIIWDAISEDLFSDLTGNVAFVKFTTIAFILTLEILWALVGCVAACIPVTREQVY
ncbi:hypothetical protein BSL78_12059 [Apostichopus japonicus]|uniref:Transmembrane protein n=1 Tax=Stichopus japonicus TaxID=307972 RepID=A0A2G8KSU6_STIJA|nr:hypothetical protein BSL78_12059 [Apostichopus japonicus]